MVVLERPPAVNLSLGATFGKPIYDPKFAEHIGVSDNQLPLGVLESIFFSLFRALGGLLAGASGGGILPPTCGTRPSFFGFLKMVKNATPLKRNAHF